ncbi:MAG: hypothetical protein IKF52_01655 [Clostridia bacterium]|nr:hypothetical protein [Clostridia bacterium]
MPNIDYPENMESLSTREELETAVEQYKSSPLYYVYLRMKIKDYLNFKEMSSRELTFGEFCSECVKIIEKNKFEI